MIIIISKIPVFPFWRENLVGSAKVLDRLMPENVSIFCSIFLWLILFVLSDSLGRFSSFIAFMVGIWRFGSWESLTGSQYFLFGRSEYWIYCYFWVSNVGPLQMFHFNFVPKLSIPKCIDFKSSNPIGQMHEIVWFWI